MKTYHYTIHTEDLVSRIPSLFPYTANDNIEIETVGSWGHYVMDLDVNGTPMSYRTLMNRYYDGDESVREFVERGIGKRYFKDYDAAFASESDYNLFMEKYSFTPEFVYLANVKNLIEKYKYYQNLCNCFKNDTEKKYDKETRLKLCCLCEEYYNMGGDTFLSWLELLDKEEYPEFETTGVASSVITVPLSASVNDLGIYDLYVNRWQAGTRYKSGETVTYRNPVTGIDESYRCIGVKSNVGGTTVNGNVDPDGFVIGSEGFFNELDEKVYFPNEIKTFDGGKTMTKIFHLINSPDVGDIIVDTFERPNIYMPDAEENNYELFRPDDYNGLYVENVKSVNRLAKWEKDFESASYDDENACVTYSKLQALRRNRNYMNARRKIETPDSEHDWLWYYKVGQVTNVQTLQDDLGNIMTIDGIQPSRGDAATKAKKSNLYAYGDVLQKITIGRPIYCSTINETTGYAAEYAAAEAIVKERKADNYRNSPTCPEEDKEKTTEQLVEEGKIQWTAVEVRDQIVDALSNNGCKSKNTIKAVGETILSDENGAQEHIHNGFHLVYNEENGNDIYLLWRMASEAVEYTYVKNGKEWEIHKEYIGESEGGVTFEYVIGAHLTADVVNVKYDNDGNKLVSYNNYAYDEKDRYHGIRYKETHYFDPEGELAKLAATTGGKMDDYLDPSKDIPQVERCEFSLYADISKIITEDDDKHVEYYESLAKYEFTNSAMCDYLHAPLMKKDYMVGISYPVKTDIDIYINRGNAAAFERHIKLGEIKTMEDLENYANGSFFNIQTLE